LSGRRAAAQGCGEVPTFEFVFYGLGELDDLSEQ
jgi:hypothetical protein